MLNQELSQFYSGKNRTSRLNEEAGSSLIGSLMALAVSSIVMMGIMTMLEYQQRETRSLFETIGSLEVEKILMQSLMDNEICTYMLTDKSYDSANPKTFDETRIGSPSPPTISIAGNKIAAGVSATSSDGKSLVKVGESAIGMSKNLVVNEIKITDISDIGGNKYLANIEVGFDSSKLIRALKPIKIRTILRTDDSSPRKLVGCGNAKGLSPSASAAITPATIKKQHRWYANKWVYDSTSARYTLAGSRCALPVAYDTLRTNSEGRVYSNCTESAVVDAFMFCYSDVTGYQQVPCP